jgi:hypothetical protein
VPWIADAFDNNNNPPSSPNPCVSAVSLSISPLSSVIIEPSILPLLQLLFQSRRPVHRVLIATLPHTVHTSRTHLPCKHKRSALPRAVTPHRLSRRRHCNDHRIPFHHPSTVLALLFSIRTLLHFPHHARLRHYSFYTTARSRHAATSLHRANHPPTHLSSLYTTVFLAVRPLRS